MQPASESHPRRRAASALVPPTPTSPTFSHPQPSLFGSDAVPRPRHASEAAHSGFSSTRRTMRRTYAHHAGRSRVAGTIFEHDSDMSDDDSMFDSWATQALAFVRSHVSRLATAVISAIGMAAWYALVNPGSNVALGSGVPNMLAASIAMAQAVGIGISMTAKRCIVSSAGGRAFTSDLLFDEPRSDLDKGDLFGDDCSVPLLPTASSQRAMGPAKDMPEGTTMEALLVKWTNKLASSSLASTIIVGSLMAWELAVTAKALAAGDLLAYLMGQAFFTGIQLLPATATLGASVGLAIVSLSKVYPFPLQGYLYTSLLSIHALVIRRLQSQFVRTIPPAPRSKVTVPRLQLQASFLACTLLALLSALWSEVRSLHFEALSLIAIHGPMFCMLLVSHALCAAANDPSGPLNLLLSSSSSTTVRLPVRAILNLVSDLAALVLVTAGFRIHLDASPSPWNMLYATICLQVVMYIRLVLWRPQSVGLDTLGIGSGVAGGNKWTKVGAWWTVAIVMVLALGMAVKHGLAKDMANPNVQRVVLVPTMANRPQATLWDPADVDHAWIVPAPLPSTPSLFSDIFSVPPGLKAPATAAKVTAEHIAFGLMALDVHSVHLAIDTARTWTTWRKQRVDLDWHVFATTNATKAAARAAMHRSPSPSLALALQRVDVAPSALAALQSMHTLAKTTSPIRRPDGSTKPNRQPGPRKQWYAVAGPQSAWLMSHLTQFLSELDPAKPIWLSGASDTVLIVSASLAEQMRVKCDVVRDTPSVCLRDKLQVKRFVVPVGDHPASLVVTPTEMAPTSVTSALETSTQIAMGEWARTWSWQVPGAGHAGWKVELVHGVRAKLVVQTPIKGGRELEELVMAEYAVGKVTERGIEYLRVLDASSDHASWSDMDGLVVESKMRTTREQAMQAREHVDASGRPWPPKALWVACSPARMTAGGAVASRATAKVRLSELSAACVSA